MRLQDVDQEAQRIEHNKGAAVKYLSLLFIVLVCYSLFAASFHHEEHASLKICADCSICDFLHNAYSGDNAYGPILTVPVSFGFDYGSESVRLFRSIVLPSISGRAPPYSA